MIIVPDSVFAYLHFGYLPERQTDLRPILGSHLDDNGCSQLSSGLDDKRLIEIGVAILRQAFREESSKAGVSKTHVVPLSGGLDSRAILGGLLENVGCDRIQAVTFGTPGTWDFDIGRIVAHKVGVRNESMDLSSADWRWDSAALVRTASQLKRPVWVFDTHVNRQIPERFGTDCVYWSGFMGDPIAGSHLPNQESGTWEEARSRFVERNRFCRSLGLAPPNSDPARHLPASPFVSQNLLCYDEQLDFGVRQQCWIRQIVLHSGYEYKTPFLHQEWVDFMLGVPRPYRERQRLYKEILKTAYPKLFSLPTKSNRGLALDAPWFLCQVSKAVQKARSVGQRLVPIGLWGDSPLTNYIDFDRGLREREDLRTVVYENLQDLKKRGVVDWIDCDTIWNRHQRREGDYADALTLLASLEVNLKAKHAFSSGNTGAD